jgi:hypothetical protein
MLIMLLLLLLLLQACEDDVLPSCEVEEKIWGLWGQPSSPGYQRLLT